MSIRYKILILIFIVIVAAGGITTFIARDVSRDTVRAQISDHLSTTAQSKSQQIETALAEKRERSEMVGGVITSLLSGPYLTEMGDDIDPAIMGAVLQLTKQEDPLTLEAVIWDKQGKLLTSTNPDYDFVADAKDEEFFLTGFEQTYLSDMYMDSGLNEPVQFSASPVVIGGEVIAVVGVITASYDLLAITTNRTGLGETGEAYLVNKDGYIITPLRFTDDAMFNHRIGTERFQQSNIEGAKNETVSSQNYLGVDVLAISTEIPETGWTLMVEKGSSEAFSPVSKMTRTMLWVFIGVLSAGALGAIFLSGRITGSLRHLNQGVQEVMKGNLDYKFSVTDKDEIGKLSTAFEEMTEALKRSRAELEDYNTRLEDMVKDRTRELSETNEGLRREMAERNKAEYDLRKAHNQLKEAMEKLENSQEQLLQSEKLAAVGQLVSGVAHELNNPLMAISGYTELMLRRVEDETTKRDLERLQEDTNRAIAIIRNLLSFARKQETQKMPVSVNDIIQSVVKLRSYELSLENISMETDLDPDLPEAMGDFQQLQQVFLNLLLNAEHALKDRKKGGKLSIKTRNTDSNITVNLSDNGPGIPPEVQENVFEPFFTTKEVGEGTGLGLSICYGIVEEHGGKIYFQSTSGEGTVFTVELPVAIQEDTAGTL
ncbi:MAG: ATP-binding protein [Dehalococcoidia bacterium]